MIRDLAPSLQSCYTGIVRQFLCLLTLFFSVPALHAQAGILQTTPGTPSPSGIFPLALVLEAAGFTAPEIWRPDWPVELPPDAFRLLSGEAYRITLKVEGAGGRGLEGESFLLSFSHDREGRVREFPFMLNGRMAQVSLGLQDGEIREITVGFPPYAEAWELEFLEHQGYYALIRAYIGGVWYFITISRWARGITETWFDAEGNAIGAYGFSLSENGERQRIRSIRDFFSDDIIPDFVYYYYDSWGLLTKVSGPGGIYTVLYYRDALPRHWERRPAGGAGAGVFYLQWDAGGFFVRMTRTEPGAAGDWPVEYRFEYTLDEKGNWIERREIRMIRQGGLLFSAPGTIVRRILEYRQP